MLRMPSWRLFGLAAVLAANSGCSEDSVAPIDQDATIAKSLRRRGFGAECRRRPSRPSEEAAKLHSKLH